MIMPSKRYLAQRQEKRWQALEPTTAVPILRLTPPQPRPDIGTDRGLPYILRGRDEEFSHIASTLNNPESTTYVIEAPPGTGKTALAQAVGAYAARCELTVLNVDASAISTPGQLAYNLWCLFDVDGIPQQLKPYSPNINLSYTGIQVGNGNVNPMYQQFPVNLKHSIQQCFERYGRQNNHTRGFLIIIDNAATWRDAENEDHPDHHPLKNLCNTLNDAVRNIGFPITTVFAGTAGTTETIRILTSGRLDKRSRVHLAEVTDSACAQIIQDHLRVQSKKNKRLLPANIIPPQTMAQLVKLCDGNVWHAGSIGQQLQTTLLQQPDIADDENEIIKTARAARQLVYADMYDRLKTTADNCAAQAFTYLTEASQICNNRLEPNQTRKLMQDATQETEANLTIDELVQNGLVEYRQPAKNYAHQPENNIANQEHYRIPIPNFANYMQERYPDPDKIRHKTVQKHVQIMPSIRPWHWRQQDKIYSFVAPPPDPLERHQPGDATTLRPAVAGDQPSATASNQNNPTHPAKEKKDPSRSHSANHQPDL